MREFMSIITESPNLYRPFRGTGGLCGQAAIAINRAVFAGQGKLVGAFNDAFVDHRLIGHVAVQVGYQYWDSDARSKTEDEILSWGMLDFYDPDWIEAAAECGITWTEEAASGVGLYEMTEEEVIRAFGSDKINQMVAWLK